MRPLRVLAVAGTRPEAIKLAPVVLRLRADPAFRVRLLATGQHRELLRHGFSAFGLRPDADLRVMRPGQTPAEVLGAVLSGVGRELARRRPDLVLVQGDTTSALAAALAASRAEVPVAHVEAGLRSGDLSAPFPEELNRIAIDRVASLHFAPTRLAARNLRREGVPARSIVVTGNTAVDALERVLGRARPAARPRPGRLAVVTLHRRESHGPVLAGLVRALGRAARRLPDVTWVCPVHPNPAARAALRRLRGPRFRLVAPLPYAEFARLLAAADFAVTDSGGIQEEAPTLNLRYLVLRRGTERPEGLGRWGEVAGVEPKAVESAILRLARRPRPRPGPSPFGDGRAAERIAAALARLPRRRRGVRAPGRGASPRRPGPS